MFKTISTNISQKMIRRIILGLFKIEKNTGYFFESSSSIFSNIKPLLILCKLFATLPLGNITGDLSDVTFKWRSWEVVLTGLFYPFVWLVGFIIMYNNEEPFLIHITPHALCHILSNICFSCGCKTLIELLKSIDKFDKLCFEFNSLHEDKRLKTYKYLWAIFAGSSHSLVVVSYLALYDLQESCVIVGGTCTIVLTYFQRTQRQIQSVLFIFLSYELSIRFKNLDLISEQFLQTSIQFNGDNFNRDLENCRLLYKELTYCTRMFNDVFGFRMVVVLSYFFLEAFNTMLAVMFFPNFYDRLRIIYIIHSFMFVCAAAARADCLQKATKGIQEVIKKLHIRDLPYSTRWQVNHFLHQCDLNNISISACGIVTINNQLLFLIVSCITTIVIALIQIVPESRNL